MTEKQPFFSIVMPVYNARKYLAAAVGSILNQSYRDFELILVDDCSTDGSDEICRKMADEDGRIVYERMPQNGGASAARNRTLKLARGQYIGFVDSDDTIDGDLFEKAHATLVDGHFDCLKFGCLEEYYSQDGQLKYTKTSAMEDGEYHSGIELWNQMVHMEMIPLFGYAWNGFYSKAITAMHGILFDTTLRVNEDFDFNIRFFQYVECLKCVSWTPYHYSKRAGASLSSQEKNYSYDAQMMKIRGLIGLYPSLEQIPAAARSDIFWMYTRFAFALMVRAKRNGNFKSTWDRICQDPLYKAFCQTEFTGLSGKKKQMIGTLKAGKGLRLYLLLEMIYIAKTYLPVLFAMVKK